MENQFLVCLESNWVEEGLQVEPIAWFDILEEARAALEGLWPEDIADDSIEQLVVVDSFKSVCVVWWSPDLTGGTITSQSVTAERKMPVMDFATGSMFDIFKDDRELRYIVQARERGDFAGVFVSIHEPDDEGPPLAQVIFEIKGGKLVMHYWKSSDIDDDPTETIELEDGDDANPT